MRTCGVLLPVASLPSKYGIGTFSKEAYELLISYGRQDRITGRFCLWGLQDMEIRPISLSLHLREILILLI